MHSLVAKDGAKPRGAYPHIKRVGDLIYISGTSARQADNDIVGAAVDAMGAVDLDIRAQTRATIENIRTILQQVGSDLDDVVDITTFLINMNDFKGYNEAYAAFFGYDGPTRTTVAVHQLPHPHLLVEIKAIAYRPILLTD